MVGQSGTAPIKLIIRQVVGSSPTRPTHLPAETLRDGPEDRQNDSHVLTGGRSASPQVRRRGRPRNTPGPPSFCVLTPVLVPGLDQFALGEFS